MDRPAAHRGKAPRSGTAYRSTTRNTAVLVAALALLGASVSLAGPAEAAGTSYHVDNRTGSNCSDSGPGSAEQPWCSFTPVNARGYSAGDRILLARGATWSESLDLTGSGTATDRIELGAYGSGAAPRILKGSGLYGIVLSNVSHWSVKNLEIDGRGEQKLINGIRVVYTGAEGIGHQDLNFSGLNLHHNHMGIFVTGDSTPDSSQWAVKGVRMTSIEGHRNEVSIAFGAERRPRTYIQDTVLSRLNLHNDNGEPVPHKDCPNSLTLQSMTRVSVMDSLVSHAGGCPTEHGTTGIYLGNVNDATLTNNIVAFTNQSGSPDQSGINYEGWTDNVAARGNLITGNVRWGIGLQGIHTDGGNTDATVENNTIVENGLPPIASLGTQAPTEGTIRGNLWGGDSLTTTVSGGTFDKISVGSNPGPVAGDRVWFAARDFAAAQSTYGWRYQQSRDGGATWSDLSHQGGENTWRPAAGALPMVGQWQFHPSVGGTQVAKTWTAPRDGTVAIRGQAAKATLGGDGVRVQVTHNGKQVVTPRVVAANDRTGTPTSVDSLAVRAGDTLRFAVDAGAAGETSNDTTSWTPVVGYLG